FHKEGVLAPGFPAIGGDEQKGILGQWRERFTGYPAVCKIRELNVVETSTSDSWVCLAKASAAVVACEQDRIQGDCLGMNVAGREQLIANGLDRGQFQVDRAGLVGRTA